MTENSWKVLQHLSSCTRGGPPGLLGEGRALCLNFSTTIRTYSFRNLWNKSCGRTSHFWNLTFGEGVERSAFFWRFFIFLFQSLCIPPDVSWSFYTLKCNPNRTFNATSRTLPAPFLSIPKQFCSEVNGGGVGQGKAGTQGEKGWDLEWGAELRQGEEACRVGGGGCGGNLGLLALVWPSCNSGCHLHPEEWRPPLLSLPFSDTAFT